MNRNCQNVDGVINLKAEAARKPRGETEWIRILGRKLETNTLPIIAPIQENILNCMCCNLSTKRRNKSIATSLPGLQSEF